MPTVLLTMLSSEPHATAAVISLRVMPCVAAQLYPEIQLHISGKTHEAG